MRDVAREHMSQKAFGARFARLRRTVGVASAHGTAVALRSRTIPPVPAVMRRLPGRGIVLGGIGTVVLAAPCS